MKSHRTLRVVSEPHASPGQMQYVEDSLAAFNISVTGHADFAPVNLFIKSAHGEVMGGLLGYVWGQWLHVKILWIAEPLRREGYGHKLLDAAETLAQERGCFGSYLDTHSFQARPFYEKAGYRVVATVDDYPVGHAKHFLIKRFGPPGRGAKRRPRRWAQGNPMGKSPTSRSARRIARSRG